MTVLADIEERLAIVHGDIGNVLLRRSRVPDTADIGHSRETGEIAGQADADAILQLEGGIAGIARTAGRACVVVAQAVDEALVSDHGRSAVKGTATARAIAQAIVEGADTRAGQRALGRRRDHGRHFRIPDPALTV